MSDLADAEILRALQRIEATLAQLGRRREAEVVSLRRAAQILGIDRTRTLPALISAGSIRTVEIAGHARITRRELDRVLSEGAPLEPPARPRARRQAWRSTAEEVAAIKAIPIPRRR